METKDRDTTGISYKSTGKTSGSNRTSSPFKARVTFQLGSEDNDDEISSTLSDKCGSGLSKASEKNNFKRRVSKLMEDKDTWGELTKDLRKDDEDDVINNDFRSVANFLLKKSSIYAVSQVGHAKSPYRKILWILVLAAGLFGCGYEIYRFLVLYFQYPVVVNLHVKNEKSLEFPAVTICNLNRMQKKYKICMERNISATNCITPHVTGTRVTMSERRSMASCTDQFSGTTDPDFNKNMEFLSKYSQMDSSSRKAFGYQINDFILSCSFNGEPCSFGYFSYFQSLKYGNCYTFNKFSIEDDTLLKTSFVGVMNGLDLTLNFDPESYLPIASSVGARVIIHDSHVDPNPEEEGVNISPGFETTLAMKQTCVSRLPAPYKDNCITYGKDKSIRGNNRNECVRSCMQEVNYARCSCIDPTLPSFNDYRHCNMTDFTDACCLDDALEFMATSGLPCGCPLPCFSTTYDLRLSTAVWPSGLSYFDSFCSKCAIDKELLQRMRQNQARLKIYYSTLEKYIYEQKAMFQDSELFSHLGGQLGLWLGLSIVAAFELLENIIYICKYCTSLASGSSSE